MAEHTDTAADPGRNPPDQIKRDPEGGNQKLDAVDLTVNVIVAGVDAMVSEFVIRAVPHDHESRLRLEASLYEALARALQQKGELLRRLADGAAAHPGAQ